MRFGIVFASVQGAARFWMGSLRMVGVSGTLAGIELKEL